MRGRTDSLLWFSVVAIIALASDLVSKSYVTEWVSDEGGVVVIVPGWFQFISRLNQGGVWSFLHWLGGTANSLLLCFSAVAAIAICAWAVFGLKAGERRFAVILGMIEGGAIGNMHDRWVFGGVRDFIDVHYYEAYHYPTFNVADSFLVVGMLLILFGPFLGLRPSECSGSDSSTGSSAEDADGSA